MPFIPRQVKPPARVALTCKVPASVATLLKRYAEFLDSSQEYVVTETLRLAFRKDREFQTWLTTTHPGLSVAVSADTGQSNEGAPAGGVRSGEPPVQPPPSRTDHGRAWTDATSTVHEER